MPTNEIKIIIAGFGGQGTMLAGNILARGCVMEDKHVAGMVSYGAEVRGGTANASVVISDSQIASPVIINPDIAVILNQPSLDKFQDILAPGGLVVLNSSLVTGQVEREDLDVVKIDATEIAAQLGNVRVANIVALGALIEKTHLLKAESIERAIEDSFLAKKPKLVEINKKAFRAAAEALVGY